MINASPISELLPRVRLTRHQSGRRDLHMPEVRSPRRDADIPEGARGAQRRHPARQFIRAARQQAAAERAAKYMEAGTR